jgi:homogentisate 1,2-dioxygenase
LNPHPTLNEAAMSENHHGLTLAAGSPYQSGCGNEFATEAVADVLPVGRAR